MANRIVRIGNAIACLYAAIPPLLECGVITLLIFIQIWELAVLDALKHGRGYVAFEVFGNTEGFRAYVDSGRKIFLTGSTVSLGEAKELVVQAPNCSGNCMIQILKDGEGYREEKNSGMRLALPEPGIYSAMVRRDGHPWNWGMSFG